METFQWPNFKTVAQYVHNMFEDARWNSNYEELAAKYMIQFDEELLEERKKSRSNSPSRNGEQKEKSLQHRRRQRRTSCKLPKKH